MNARHAGPVAPPGSARISMAGISKRFDQTLALDRVDLQVDAGEIHALCGQNGSGKSTLVKILSNVVQPDSGDLVMWGQTPRHGWRAADFGVAVIHQNLALLDNMSVLENFGVTDAFGVGARPFVAWAKERRLLRKYAQRVGLAVSAATMLADLRPSDRSLLAIARALRELDSNRREGAERLLILDEPTTYLPADEKQKLAATMRTLAGEGIGIILVSHELDYVLSVADTVTVLRDGSVRGSAPAAELDKHEIVRLMIGQSLDRFYPDRSTAPKGEPLLELRQLSGIRLEPLSLNVAAGEVVGVTGLVGGGQEEVPYLAMDAYAGRSPQLSITAAAAAAASDMSSAIAIVPANRDMDGMWFEGTAAENLTLASLRRYRRRGLLVKAKERELARSAMVDVGVRPVRPDLSMHQFSGGNQQKIILARWLSTPARVFILHEPVQGIDVAANAEIFRLIVRAAERGAAVLICSNEWEHLVNLCDRVVALRDGQVVTELSGDDLTESTLAAACQGVVDPLPIDQGQHHVV